MSDHISKQEYHSLWQVIMDLQKEIAELRLRIDGLANMRRRAIMAAGIKLLDAHNEDQQQTEN